MDQFYEEVSAARSRAWTAQLVPILREWMNAQEPLPPAQRAAALLAADRLIAASGGEFSAALRSQLEDLGASFGGREVDFPYKKTWLTEARVLAPDGEVDKMAVLAMVSRGNCDWAGWPSEKVVAEAEPLLSRPVDEATRTHLHFVLGYAYTDLVVLQENPDYVIGSISPEPHEEAVALRAKALEHYRAALSADTTSPTARDAWRQAWHLLAHVLPRTRYVCGDI
jgi:hypothetical protein